MAVGDIKEPAGAAKGPVGDKKGGDRIQCLVVTPERVVLDNLAEFVAVPLFDGELGILPGRTPLIGRLGFGELRTRDGGLVNRYFVDGGFVQVRDDVVTVLTNRAIPAAKIDSVAAEEELEAARSRIARSEPEQLAKTQAVARSRALMRVAEASETR